MPVTFTKVSLPWGWLGNMSPFPIDYNGCRWNTAEALFQSLRFKDRKTIKTLCAERSPYGAKLIAKANKTKMVVVPQSPQDVANMEMVLRLKLKQHPQLAQMLRDSGGEEIIEDVTSRPGGSGMFWGAALRGDKWQGQNVLGKLWMKLRSGL